MQSCYNCIVTLPYSKFTFDHVHLLSDSTTFLFGLVHFPFRSVKKTFEGCFSFYTTFSSYTFHSYTFHSYTFFIRILFFILILFIRILFFYSYALFHSYTFYSYTFFHSYTISFVYLFSSVYFSFVYLFLFVYFLLFVYTANSKFSRRQISSLRFWKWDTYYSLWEQKTGTELNVFILRKSCLIENISNITLNFISKWVEYAH